MGNTAYGLPSRRLLEAPKRSYVIPHKGIDCVSLRVNGEHQLYACYHHAPMVIAMLQDGDERIAVDQWGVMKKVDGSGVQRDASKGVVCCIV